MTKDESIKETPIEIPPDQISPETLRSLVESFVLREGTDYGSVEVSLDKKIEQVLQQIQRKEVKILFDQVSESVSLLTSRDYKKRLDQKIVKS